MHNLLTLFLLILGLAISTRLLRRVLKQWGWNGHAPLLFTVPDTGHHWEPLGTSWPHD